MSFNIRNLRAKDGVNGWELRRELLCELVRRHRPDVLGIQEAFFPQVEQMRHALPDYDSVGVGRDDGKTEGEYCSLFFLRDRFRPAEQGTFWLSATPDVPGSKQWTREYARICTWIRLVDTSGQAFYAYNTHLDHESQFAREQSIRLILERIQRREHVDPVLLIGDFNMEEDDPAIANFMTARPQAFRDTFRAVHPDAKVIGTFHGFTESVNGAKIDFIFASAEWMVLDARILHDNEEGRYPSDHFPITATLLVHSDPTGDTTGSPV